MDKLKSSIIAAIRHQELMRARRYVIVSLAVAITSGASVLYSLWYLVQELASSSFYSYFSLLFSDPDLVPALWRELALSLAETMPLFALIASMAAFAVLLVSIRVCVGNARGVFAPSFSN